MSTNISNKLEIHASTLRRHSSMSSLYTIIRPSVEKSSAYAAINSADSGSEYSFSYQDSLIEDSLQPSSPASNLNAAISGVHFVPSVPFEHNRKKEHSLTLAKTKLDRLIALVSDFQRDEMRSSMSTPELGIIEPCKTKRGGWARHFGTPPVPRIPSVYKDTDSKPITRNGPSDTTFCADRFLDPHTDRMEFKPCEKQCASNKLPAATESVYIDKHLESVQKTTRSASVSTCESAITLISSPSAQPLAAPLSPALSTLGTPIQSIFSQRSTSSTLISGDDPHRTEPVLFYHPKSTCSMSSFMGGSTSEMTLSPSSPTDSVPHKSFGIHFLQQSHTRSNRALCESAGPLISTSKPNTSLRSASTPIEAGQVLRLLDQGEKRSNEPLNASPHFMASKFMKLFKRTK
ncbi:hypothetical protein QVD99_003779 [Batrachochytrium dendrobatidis]|nr:hypothetical protein O5D80_004088 [Batrachochytrium dendrobatidis]KAK5669383.1 hypothetical protein QVD99_003779 [Batrachochytrium dendrobatidis]